MFPPARPGGPDAWTRSLRRAMAHTARRRTAMARWAYSFPFGSENLGILDECTDADVRRWPIGRIRDQAVAVDMEAARTEGRLQELAQTLEMLEGLVREASASPGLVWAVERTRAELVRTLDVRQW